MDRRLVDADPAAGFNYPYLLAAPETAVGSGARPILVEPPSLPGPTDDADATLEEARNRADGGFSRRVADELGVPYLQPVFPRPVSDPVDWTHYTHSLCRQTLGLSGTPLDRLDRQLLAMVDHARALLREHGIEPAEQFCLDGFSSSGTFANRFAALHPDALISVSAGGFNGMAILPIEAAEVPIEWTDRRTLRYPVGIADLEALTGEPFDREAFCRLHQFCYLGADDDNDPLLYPDAWTGVEERASAILVYGDDIHAERFPTSRRIYKREGVPAVFKRYPDTGHEPVPAFDDVVAFHAMSIDGADIGAIREHLGVSRPVTD